MSKELIKSIGISILVVIAIILLITILSYDKIAIGKVIPKIQPYELNEEIKNEIQAEDNQEDTEIVTTYELDASDLKTYERTKKYNKGKKNPFEQESVAVQTGNSTNSNTTATGDEKNSTSTNFYKDEVIK